MDSDEIMDLLRGAPGNRHLREALDITMTAAEKQHMLVSMVWFEANMDNLMFHCNNYSGVIY